MHPPCKDPLLKIKLSSSTSRHYYYRLLIALTKNYYYDILHCTTIDYALVLHESDDYRAGDTLTHCATVAFFRSLACTIAHACSNFKICARIARRRAKAACVRLLLLRARERRLLGRNREA